MEKNGYRTLHLEWVWTKATWEETREGQCRSPGAWTFSVDPKALSIWYSFSLPSYSPTSPKSHLLNTASSSSAPIHSSTHFDLSSRLYFIENTLAEAANILVGKSKECLFLFLSCLSVVSRSQSLFLSTISFLGSCDTPHWISSSSSFSVFCWISLSVCTESKYEHMKSVYNSLW